MSLIKQSKQTFKTIYDLKEYIDNQKESLCFWTMIKSFDASEKINRLQNEIAEAEELLMEWKNKEEV